MDRRGKPKKDEAKAKRPLARKSPKDHVGKASDLENRLAQVLKREAEALEQQTATSEILGVIGRSPTAIQPVFDAIVRSASRLCHGHWAVAVRFDGQLIHLAAEHNIRPDAPS